MKKSTPIVYIIFVIIMGIIGWQKGWFGNSTARRTATTSSATPYHLDRSDSIVYTRHARCRMGCRHVTAKEVGEIIASGTINKAKSDPVDKPCPTIALEGYSHERQHLRIVVATCGDELRVVTCIDLDKDWPCHCD